MRLPKQAPILILDDSASALDFATDAKLREAIKNQTPRPTTFIVSQRAASVQYADLILVLDEGNLVGKGTHEELLANNEIYQEIYYSQFPRRMKHETDNSWETIRKVLRYIRRYRIYFVASILWRV